MGIMVIKCIKKKSGFSFFKIFFSGINFVNKIIRLNILDFKTPVIGKKFPKSKFDKLKTFTLNLLRLDVLSFHSPIVSIIETS